MNLFQVISSLLIISSSLKVIRLFRRRNLVATELLLWTGIWLAGLTVILFPEVTVGLAHTLGIQRGSDLIIYSSIIALFLILLRLWIKIRSMGTKIGLLVSKLANLEYEKEGEDIEDRINSQKKGSQTP